MLAAQYGADNAVKELLRSGANPDTLNRTLGFPALCLAVYSKCSSTISLLAPMTNTGVKEVLKMMAMEKVEVNESMRGFITRAVTDEDRLTLIDGLTEASNLGHTTLVNLLCQGRDLPESRTHELLRLAVKSDNRETCAAILTLFKGSPPPDVIAIAEQRGIREVIQLFVPEGQQGENMEAKKIKLRQDILNKKVGPNQLVPKSAEFKYNHEIRRVAPLLESGCEVSYSTLLKAFHIPEAHPDDECPSECDQTESCEKMREIFALVKMIVSAMGKINPLFVLGKGRHPSIVGSLKEGTRCFFLDEMDVHVSLNKRLRKFCYFDAAEQKLKVNKENASEDIRKYVKEDVFDCKAFFDDFVDALVKAIQMVDLANGFYINDKYHKFTMIPLSMEYVPCLRCMDMSVYATPQAKRCRHNAECIAHHEQGMQECEDGCKGTCEYFSHKKTCDCQEFTSPNVTITKIGAALHVQFPDGTTVDCDLNVPTIPTHTPYHGKLHEVKIFLSGEKPVGWLEEYSKLEDLAIANRSSYSIDTESWQVKMRKISRDIVLPRQVGATLCVRFTYNLIFPRAFSSSTRRPCATGKETFMCYQKC